MRREKEFVSPWRNSSGDVSHVVKADEMTIEARLEFHRGQSVGRPS
jgi:hypothetical protein